MSQSKVFESEYRFMQILWENEPIKSMDLVKKCQSLLQWKPSTTFTVIKRLSERGVIINENTMIRALVTKNQVQSTELDEMFEKRFDHSIPSFVAALVNCRSISSEDLVSLRQLIDEWENKQHDY